MTNHLLLMRESILQITGRSIAESTAPWLLKVGPWELHLEIPADPQHKPEPSEPVADCYVGAVVRLYHRSTVVATESCWGIAEDLNAGSSANHPFWEHLAEVTCELAAELLGPNRLERVIACRKASLDAMAADVAALAETTHTAEVTV